MIKHVVAVQLDQVEGVEEDDNGRWNGCCDKIRFCYLSAEGAGKPTSPYSTLISLVRGRLAPDCVRKCRVLGAKRKSCARPEHYQF